MRTLLQNKKSMMIKFAIVFGVIVTSVLLMKKKDMSYRQSILKTMYPVIMFPGKLMGAKNASKLNTDNKQPQKDFYALQAVLNNGDTLSFETFRGKKVLLVNTASDCGYTGQYKELEALYREFKDSNFVIVGFPANNFMSQEPGTDDEIAAFCSKNYGVSFPMMSKISVKGKDMHPVYQFLTSEEQNGVMDSKVTWNFQKYLLGPDGTLEKVISPRTDPDDPEVITWIENNGS